jgi:type IX secretion system PorP/SprF family membrane protein
MLQRALYFLILMCSVNKVLAQQDAQFSQYMFNNLYLTPAYSGVDGVTKISAFHRSQWLGYQSSFGDGGAPVTQMISFNTPIFKIKSGFGMYAINDNLGPQNNLEVQGSYAYHLGIKESKLSFGVRIGMYSQTLNYDVYRPIHKDDELLQNKTGKESQIRPDMAFGMFYRSEKYYLGAGFNHLLKSQFDFGVSQRNALETHLNATAGYFYEVSFDLKILFSTLVKSDFNKTTIDGSAIAFYKDTMWGGVSVRQSEAANLLLGYSLLKDKSLKFGTSIDFVVVNRAAKENFSLEFMLGYELPINPGSGKKVVRTPRYRH